MPIAFQIEDEIFHQFIGLGFLADAATPILQSVEWRAAVDDVYLKMYLLLSCSFLNIWVQFLQPFD